MIRLIFEAQVRQPNNKQIIGHFERKKFVNLKKCLNLKILPMFRAYGVFKKLHDDLDC